MDRFKASSAAAVGTENLPPQSLWEVWSDILPPSGDGETGRLRLLGVFLCSLVCRHLLITNGAYSGREAVEPDEARRIALLINIVFAERDEPLVIECVLALATDHRRGTLEQ